MTPGAARPLPPDLLKPVLPHDGFSFDRLRSSYNDTPAMPAR
jgi:hypothetical protein